MGAVLTPQLAGIDEAAHLPNASTFCGRCQAVCPMNIPLPKMMRQWREREFLQSPQGSRPKLLLRCWSFLAQNPPLYRAAAGVAAHILSLLAGKRGRFSALPFAGGWTKYRDFPAPAPRTFQSLWRERQRRKERDG
jgi:L-lactate dehydrogenase complex protein LldF